MSGTILLTQEDREWNAKIADIVIPDDGSRYVEVKCIDNKVIEGMWQETMLFTLRTTWRSGYEPFEDYSKRCGL